MMLEELFKELGAEDTDLGKEEFALDERRLGVIQDSPDGDKIVELATSLLDYTVLALEDHGHARQVLDFCAADDQTVNVEAAGCEDAGDPGEDARLVLDETVEDVSLGRVRRRHGRLVQDGRHGRRGVPLRGCVGDREREWGPAM